jgi:murein L,D-transpeptidase YcbB/YkuD
MRKLVIGMMVGAALLGTTAMAGAQEAVTVNGVQALRVVIAPPRTELARIIKQGLAEKYQAAARDSRGLTDAQKLYFFYGARHFEPIWLQQQADGSIAFSPNALKIVEVFKDAASEGFRPTDYLTPDLDLTTAGTDPARLAAVETAFSASALRYAQNAVGGRVNPLDVAPDLFIRPRQINAPEMLVKLATADDPAAVLMDLHPKHPEFLRLKEALAHFDQQEVEDQVEIPEGPLLKPGMHDDRVALLRERLNVEAPEVAESATTAADDNIYDKALVDAVKTFQAGLSLTADGVVGPATVAALNGGSAVTRDDILANMERWRWMPEDMGDFHVLVNIPEFRLYVEQGSEARGFEVAYTTRVVTGKPTNRTPIFSDEIEHIVVNPYWNVPPSIASKEIAPQLAANPGYLASQNMELLYGGKVVSASAVDWSATSINNFRIRQRPGGGNALGQVKFLFPNDHDVYLHDTPSKSLFARSYRAYSHGCVRVQNPWEFAQALLAHEPKLTVASLESEIGGSEKWNNLSVKVPVHLAYFTLRDDPDGTIRSYADVYGHNKRLISLLNQ